VFDLAGQCEEFNAILPAFKKEYSVNRKLKVLVWLSMEALTTAVKGFSFTVKENV
jgi:hypothetical protein